jgi:hypothetical protein
MESSRPRKVVVGVKFYSSSSIIFLTSKITREYEIQIDSICPVGSDFMIRRK